MAPEKTIDLWGQSKEQLRWVQSNPGSKLTEPEVLSSEKVEEK